MAALALGIVRDIVKTGMAIKEAVETVQRNEEDCQDIQVLVGALIPILCRLHDMGFTRHPPMCSTLMALNHSVHRALKLVKKCQKRKAMHRFLMAADMAKELRQVHHDIQLKMQLGNLAITTSMMEVTIEFARTTIIGRDGALPPPTQPLQLGIAEMENDIRLSITGDLIQSGAEPWNYAKQAYKKKCGQFRIAVYVHKGAIIFLDGQNRSVGITARSSGFLPRISRWMLPCAHRSASLPPPRHKPLRIKDSNNPDETSRVVNAPPPATLSQLFFRTAYPAVQRRRPESTGMSSSLQRPGLQG